MAIINYATREAQLKIVYAGPPHAGKTTTLEYLRAHLEAECGEMITRKTGADRTLLFDFRPRSLTVLDGFRARIALHTVPGEVTFNAPRQLVLRDADALVFVADSRWERMEENAAALANLTKNLEKQDLTLDDLPHVFQYNKRDLADIAPVSYLGYVLNNRPQRARSFETTATNGTGLIAALNAVAGLALERFVSESAATPAATA